MKKDITLVAIDFAYYDLTKFALEKTLECVDAKEVVVISDRNILSGSTHIPCKRVEGIEACAEIMLKLVWPFVDTAHAMYVQWDGMAYNSHMWTDEFLKYDYIGAPWPWQPDRYAVGNGGFSLRSKRLLNACMDPKIQRTNETPVAEDELIGKGYRSYLEFKYGIEYAPIGLAKQFSYELGDYRDSFGFHGPWNIIRYCNNSERDYFVPRIDYTGWNIYKWHHYLVELINAGRMDLYQYCVGKLVEINPNFLQNLIAMLEQTTARGLPGTGVH